MTATAPPDTIHVNSWDELDNLTADALLGSNSGKTLKTYNYECVDTINYSTLIFNIDAVLAAPDGTESRITKTAEWSVELVSVEYYAGLRYEPPHHNIPIAYYAHVDRYRNYSDGSRIGPDEFLNYGHFDFYSLDYLPPVSSNCWWGEMECIFPEEVQNLPLISTIHYYEDMFSPTNPFAPNKEPIVVKYIPLEDDGYHNYFGFRLKVNRNAYVINFFGVKLTMEELFSFDLNKEEPHYGGWEDDYTVQDFDVYRNSIDYGEMTDEKTIFNVCKDVPVVNRDTILEVQRVDTDYGRGFYIPVNVSEANISTPGSHQTSWGWYYKNFREVRQIWPYETYNYNNDYGMSWGSFGFSRESYCQYLHIDGRIIDFVEAYNLHQGPIISTVTRTSTGYHHHLERLSYLYSLPHYADCDIYIDFYDGPEDLISDMTYEELIEDFEKRKEEELMQQRETMRKKPSLTRGNDRDAKPTVRFDTRLPNSFNRNK